MLSYCQHFCQTFLTLQLVTFFLKSLAIGYLSSILEPCPLQPKEWVSQRRNPEEDEPNNLWSPAYGLLHASVFSINTGVISLKNL